MMMKARAIRLLAPAILLTGMSMLASADRLQAQTPASQAAQSAIKSTPEAPTANTRMTDESAAYLALNSNRIEEAETRFKAILADDPGDSKALAGIGYVRMQQGNFLGAISFFEQATRGNADDQGLLTALDTARLGFIVSEARNALSTGDLTVAEKRYRTALELRPDDLEALEGLGETLLRSQQPALAISLFERAIQAQPESVNGWRGLFMAQFQGGDTALALATVKRIPPATLAQLMHDPLFLQPLASAYAAVGRGAEAQATLQSALNQHFPTDVNGLKSDIEIQNAWLLYNGMDDAGLYRQLITLDGRHDVTAEQRLTVQAIWTNWATRRANQATAGGNPQRALAILNAAARAFADNPAAIKLLAAGYAQAGHQQDQSEDLSVLLAPGYSEPTPAGAVSSLAQTHTAPPPPAVSRGSIDGAYVTPPPAQPVSATQNRNGSPTAVTVQLGNNTPHPMQSQVDVTDVLPTARYGPSARANQAAASHEEVVAARAARIRRLQEDSAARTMESHPPSEDTIATIKQNAENITPAQTSPRIDQPSSPPTRQSGSIPIPSAQQYPRPITPPQPSSQTSPGLASSSGSHPYPQIVPAYPLATPPTDAELRASNLPPLGGYFKSQAPMPMTQRQRAETELASLEASYSGWLGETGIGRYRDGTAGIDRLYDVEAPAEASAVIGKSVRLTVVALPVFLHSGLLNNAGFATGNVPYLGTLAANAINPPAQQFSRGIGGEIQLRTKNIGLAVGYTPYEFLVRNFTGRVRWSTLSGHVSIYGERQPVKDTQLSYAGLHNPGTAFLPSQRPIWGGVISNSGGLRVELGSPTSSFYVSGEGGILTGQHVLDNTRFGGSTGADFRVGNWPNHGGLTLGGTLSGMHYAHNESGLSYGQGGYFSPDSYFLAAVPVSFKGRYKTNFHYVIAGSLGAQTFEQNEAPFFPLDSSLQSNFIPSNGASCTSSQAPSYNCGEYPRTHTTAFTYAFNSQASYRLGEHWYSGGFVIANNARNYNTVSAGFFLRYAFRAQRSREGFPTGLFSVEGFRSLQIP